jgi:hypothetical protein
VPSVNLVVHIGFSDEATNTRDSFKLYSTVERHEIKEIIHPVFILPNNEADALRFEIIRKTDPRLFYAKRLLYAKKLKMKEFVRRCVLRKCCHAVKNFLDHLIRQTSGSA